MDSTLLRPSPLKFNFTVERINQIAKDVITLAKDGPAAITQAVSPDTATFENVMQPLAHIFDRIDGRVQSLELISNVSPDAELRTACSKALPDIGDACQSISYDDDLFALVSAVHSKLNLDEVDYETGLLVTKTYSMFVDNGTSLRGESREKYIARDKRLTKLRVQFMDNLAADPGSVWKTEAELAGLSQSQLENLDLSEDGKRKVTLRGPDRNTVLENCSNGETRKDVFIRSQSVFPKNVEILREMVLLRNEQAVMLDYPSFAAKKLKDYIIKSPVEVEKLLDQVAGQIAPLVEQEKKELQKLLKQDESLYLWDFNYYNQKMVKEKHVDHELISEYFPANYAIPRIMDIFQTLFDLIIEEISDPAPEELWHPDVKMFAVWDGEKSLSSFLGYLYTDIHPRVGKYSHAANFNIQASYTDPEGKRCPVATSLICNMSRPSTDHPSLLKHSELVIVFHELGHGIHDLLGKSKYTMFHGHRTVRDFIEAPSQLLEYWCWDPEVLQQMSCHYTYLSETYLETWKRLRGTASDSIQPPKTIPLQLTRDLVASKTINKGMSTARMVGLSRFDMRIHNPPTHETLEQMDIGEAYNSLQTELMQIPGAIDRASLGNGQVQTSHFVWGTEAYYYSYLLTKLYAADIWHTCFKDKPMDPVAAKRYRQIILDKGGRDDMAKSLVELLGREPNMNIYFQET